MQYFYSQYNENNALCNIISYNIMKVMLYAIYFQSK